MTRVVCIHGHFYQPPRENPWTGRIEPQPSAYPFSNWNERIFSECYAPNVTARLLDGEGKLRRPRNNYRTLSFDMGPTLLSWMEQHEPQIHRAIVRADRESVSLNGGHGNAMAQSYHHSILPLCSEADRETEVLWGIADFKHRFGRQPEGMWLPESAVNTETLETLAACGLSFVILAPGQAEAIKAPTGEWQPTPHAGALPTHRPYHLPLPSGRSISVVFYHPQLSHDVAFAGLLDNGDHFAEHICNSFDPAYDDEVNLLVLATDGESYGHHHRYGEMALARCMEKLEEEDVTLTNCGAFLAAHPPTWEVRIRENTAWSCAHGVERWRSNCGCAINPGSGWDQEWRKPLRDGFNWLRDQIEQGSHRVGEGYFKDIRAARNEYIQLLLDPSPHTRRDFLNRHLRRPPEEADSTHALGILETQRQALKMFTSCGWFFDDIAGIEATQIIAYARRAVELAQEHLGMELEEGLLEFLQKARSNEKEGKTGQTVYKSLDHPGFVEPMTPSTVVLPAVYTEKKDSDEREAGVLLHPTSLPGGYGIGDLGTEAYHFVDWLQQTGCRVWQVLPLVPTDGTGSPYSSWSSLAGNPLLVDLRQLQEHGLLPGWLPDYTGPKDYVNHKEVVKQKMPLLLQAARSLIEQPFHPWWPEIERFQKQQTWVEDTALFAALHDHFGDIPWWKWPEPLRNRDEEALALARLEHKQAILEAICLQYFFERQWQRLRTYCNRHGIKVFGDLPIYVAGDSVDVWSAQHLFQLNAEGLPSKVAGVPPDAFSDVGQWWGNPLYNWEEMKNDRYKWWSHRLNRLLNQCDRIRLDHFRGFAAYWEIPADAPDARSGHWVAGPGHDFFAALEAEMGRLPFLAENLGDIDEEVETLRRDFELPGMRILQFGFDGNEENAHIPHVHTEDSVVYTGTHDNNTTLGWWHELDEETRHRVRFYFGIDGHDISWNLIRAALLSVARWAIIPLQDLLKLDGEHRMNVPGTAEKNWHWRCSTDAFRLDVAGRLNGLIQAFGRCGRS
jgi:4-alpha-glucanotransferase